MITFTQTEVLRIVTRVLTNRTVVLRNTKRETPLVQEKNVDFGDTFPRKKIIKKTKNGENKPPTK